ncbi:hypothetical protein HDU67_002273 [Dinochytrium kinnereticum]|nr:hypothetical protein HDU67_002273 [Dinochytrium kinnereticum]
MPFKRSLSSVHHDVQAAKYPMLITFDTPFPSNARPRDMQSRARIGLFSEAEMRVSTGKLVTSAQRRLVIVTRRGLRLKSKDGKFQQVKIYRERITEKITLILENVIQDPELLSPRLNRAQV